MSGKNQFPFTFNWQAANPQTGFLPNNNPSGSIPSGTLTGAMASTNTIYSNIIDVSRFDNLGLDLSWTGTPTGTLSVIGSVGGASWFTITGFDPPITQPAGSADKTGVSMNQYPWKYIMLKYVNASGTGVLSALMQGKDLN